MQVMEMSTENNGKAADTLLGERVRELGDAVSRNRRMFYKRAFRYLGNAPDAEDAVQDALLSAYRNLAQFRGQAQMSSWLTAIVINAARMELATSSCCPWNPLVGRTTVRRRGPPVIGTIA